MSWEEVGLALAAVFALVALGSACLARREARRAAQAARRFADAHTRELESRRSQLEAKLMDRPLLAALFDEYEDLRTQDRLSPIALAAFARLHLSLFQDASDLLDRWGGDAGVEPASLRAWRVYMRRAFGGSTIMRDVLEKGGDEYGPSLRRRLEGPMDPVDVSISASGDGA